MTDGAGTPSATGELVRVARSTLAFGVVTLTAAFAESVCVLVRARGGFALWCAVFAQFWLPALAAAALGAASVGAVRALGGRLREQGLLGSFAGYRPLDAIAAASCVAPLAVLASSRIVWTLTGELRNRELAALACALLSLLFAIVAALVWAYLLTVARSLRERRRGAGLALTLVPGILLSLATLCWFFLEAGLRQLDPFLLVAPCAALVATPVAFRLHLLLQRRGSPWTALAAATCVSVLGALTSLIVPATTARTYQSGAWSRPAISILRALTDFDRDGYSSFFGGGDCAPFDPNVHPGAKEIPRDGIDNNCFGGDGGHARPLVAPAPGHESSKGEGPRLNLVLITIETLRADHVSFLGYHRSTTPRLDELAKTSAVFERSYATTPTTRLSVAALLSGLLPSSIRWLNQSRERQMRRIAADTPWLPALLAERGYFTLAVHTNFRAFTAVESAGFDRGFARYDTSTTFSYSGGTMHGFPGEAQVDRALSLLDERGGRPLFLWLHLLEPHYLYEQSPNVPSFGGDELALYDAEIAEADRQVGRLLDGLRARDLFDSSLLVITGDHGEEFGEHGQRFHGSNLFDPQLRTATLLRMPGLGPRRVREATSLLDLAPTVLRFLGVEGGFDQAMGRDLVPLLRDGRPLEPGFLIENFRVDDGTQALLGVLDFPFKLVQTEQRLSLYDLSRDPGETRNLWQPSDEVSRRLTDRLYEYMESGRARGTNRSSEP
ncbi:MAG TPA: sulfatase-like hydrolase/transferase [Polyangiaceae bacterium]|nr:sulfatase-like hydrolase/transferase [Polyangiaceae bacterium]